MTSKPTSKASPRAKRVWQRLTEWYGVRFTEQFGDDVPKDWAAVVDHIDNAQVQRGLDTIKQRHIQHPPTWPEFEKAMKPPVADTRAPSPGDQLCAFVMREYGNRLTTRQLRGPWSYIGSREGEITGVVINADGDRTGYRVTLDDIQGLR